MCRGFFGQGRMVGLLALVLALGVSASAWAECDSDSDCDENQYCDTWEECEEESEGSETDHEFFAQSGCEPVSRCADRRLENRCDSADECPVGFGCVDLGASHAFCAPLWMEACDGDTPCFEGTECGPFDRVCKPPLQRCSVSMRDCPDGLACYPNAYLLDETIGHIARQGEGFCRPERTPCTSNGDCEATAGCMEDPTVAFSFAELQEEVFCDWENDDEEADPRGLVPVECETPWTVCVDDLIVDRMAFAALGRVEWPSPEGEEGSDHATAPGAGSGGSAPDSASSEPSGSVSGEDDADGTGSGGEGNGGSSGCALAGGPAGLPFGGLVIFGLLAAFARRRV